MSRVARERVADVRERAQRTVFWQVWDRMLEIEFVDRSVALAGKAFVSFFPLVVVVASFMPSSIRGSIFSTMTHRFGIEGDALATAKQAFASSDDIRRATGMLGLVLTIFFATSFTTALRRVYMRAWRRPPGKKAGQYTRGPAWFLVVLAFMAALGGLRGVVGDGAGFVVFAVVAVAASSMLWWFTAWFMLLGQVRWRVLVLSGVVTGVAMAGYELSATIWMPDVVTRNQSQFGFFGVALALVTWFSGGGDLHHRRSVCGTGIRRDAGRLGELIPGGESSPLIVGAEPSFPARGGRPSPPGRVRLNRRRGGYVLTPFPNPERNRRTTTVRRR